MGDRLAEADARVEADELLGHALGNRELEPLGQEPLDVRDDVVVDRIVLHRARLALHVHETEVTAGIGDDAGEVGVAAERGHVVDELDAELERSARDDGLGGVGQAGAPVELTGSVRARLLSILPRALGASTAADVHDRRAGLEHPHADVTAASTRRWTPPSENESGVTLITPITEGRRNRSSIGGLVDTSAYFRGWTVVGATWVCSRGDSAGRSSAPWRPGSPGRALRSPRRS